MKSLLCTLILVVISVCVFAQNQKTTIYCTVLSNGKVNYYDLAKILPDNLAASILVDPMKDHNFKNGLNILMWMSLHGWHLAAALPGTIDFSFLLTREIELDDNARALFGQKLEDQVKK